MPHVSFHFCSPHLQHKITLPELGMFSQKTALWSSLANVEFSKLGTSKKTLTWHLLIFSAFGQHAAILGYLFVVVVVLFSEPRLVSALLCAYPFIH